MKSLKLVVIIIICMSCSNKKLAQINYSTVDKPQIKQVYPDSTWTFTAPSNYGFSESKLDSLKQHFEAIGGEAFFVVKNGYVIASWGEVTKPIPNWSMRKSYLNALLGMAYDESKFSLDDTLEQLNIDDVQGLTSSEKEAKIRHLLSSSSGVYHPAATESNEQKKLKPKRGSSRAGERFYYNNWDFNTLGYFYNQVTNEDLFESFETRIANEIGMEDFSLEHTMYKHEASKSKMPSFLFSSSARDDARFGYLFLRNGQWKNKQLVSENWVSMSSKLQIKTPENRYYDYGMLWWVDVKNNMYFARGNSGQYIAVIPDENMVIVFRADPGSIFKKWTKSRVSPIESFQMIPKFLMAKE
ncbi:MAG: serine hydrolase [Bacteroidota bacterium]